jgi:hypothetical protein
MLNYASLTILGLFQMFCILSYFFMVFYEEFLFYNKPIESFINLIMLQNYLQLEVYCEDFKN